MGLLPGREWPNVMLHERVHNFCDKQGAHGAQTSGRWYGDKIRRVSGKLESPKPTLAGASIHQGA